MPLETVDSVVQAIKTALANPNVKNDLEADTTMKSALRPLLHWMALKVAKCGKDEWEQRLEPLILSLAKLAQDIESLAEFACQLDESLKHRRRHRGREY